MITAEEARHFESLKAGAASPLATDIQHDAELLALRIVASDAVRQAKAEVKKVLLQDPVAATADGARSLDQAIDFWALSLALREVVGDTSRPAFVWPLDDTPRSWFGYDFPGASVGGVANPDNIYRNAFLDGSRHYEIRGRVHPNPPTTFSLELTRQTPGEMMLAPAGKLEADLGDQLGILTQREIVTDADGYFRVTLSPEPANGRANHLQTAAGPLALNHRDTLADWRQTPNSLEIRLLDAAVAGPALTEDELIRRTAAHLPGFVHFWTPFRRNFLGAPPPNQVSPLFPRDGGWGYAAGGRYALAEDEALIVVTRSGGAAYTGFQISDPWMMVPDMRAYQGSLNGSQIIPDAGGTITYAIAQRDPGIANWIDTGGHSEGWFMLRWQELAEGADVSQLLGTPQRVKLYEVDASVGEDVARVNALERRVHLAARRADYACRIGQ